MGRATVGPAREGESGMDRGPDGAEPVRASDRHPASGWRRRDSGACRLLPSGPAAPVRRDPPRKGLAPSVQPAPLTNVWRAARTRGTTENIVVGEGVRGLPPPPRHITGEGPRGPLELRPPSPANGDQRITKGQETTIRADVTAGDFPRGRANAGGPAVRRRSPGTS